MSTEVPGQAQLKQQLNALRSKLIVLHKALIDSERVEYEKSFGPLETPQQFLKVLINDPWFAWLQPFSRMVVTIDEMLESEEPIPADEVKGLIGRARTLLEVREETDDSRRSYFEALQREPDVILAHAEVMKVVNA
ncbi:MAG TPA: hypothetical protein VF773_06005 [Verrucomicrobiae bacterium]